MENTFFIAASVARLVTGIVSVVRGELVAGVAGTAWFAAAAGVAVSAAGVASVAASAAGVASVAASTAGVASVAASAGVAAVLGETRWGLSRHATCG